MIAEWTGQNPGTDLPTAYLGDGDGPLAFFRSRFPVGLFGMETDVLGGSDLPHKWLLAVLARA